MKMNPMSQQTPITCAAATESFVVTVLDGRVSRR